MFSLFQDKEFIQIKFNSEFTHISNVIQNVRNFLLPFGIKENAGIILIIRELINNAIEHGNKKNSQLIVTIHITHLENTRFKIVVEDEGQGFDYQKFKLTIPENPTQIRNRGLSLVNSFSDQLIFNEKGNCITAFVSIQRETDFIQAGESESLNEWQTIRPTGDITSENGDKLRHILLELFKKGFYLYRFDLLLVQDIDSVGLSIFAIFANMLKEKYPKFKLEIMNANSDIITLLKMTRLDSIYLIY